MKVKIIESKIETIVNSVVIVTSKFQIGPETVTTFGTGSTKEEALKDSFSTLETMSQLNGELFSAELIKLLIGAYVDKRKNDMEVLIKKADKSDKEKDEAIKRLTEMADKDLQTQIDQVCDTLGIKRFDICTGNWNRLEALALKELLEKRISRTI